MIENIKVSILVPIYGVEKYIEKCARSLFEQTYENIEYVFVNDCTQDDSIQILNNTLRDYPNRINQVRFIHHKRNLGLGGARTTAIYAATGDYIMHVDSDDFLLLNTTVEEMMQPVYKDNADVVIGDFVKVYKHTQIECKQNIPIDKMQYIKQLLSLETPVVIWGTIYKKSLYWDTHIVHTIGINMGEDLAVKARLIYEASKVVYVDKPLYAYSQINQKSYTNTFNSKHVIDLQNVIRILSIWASYKDNPDELLDCISTACAKLKAALLAKWSRSSDYKSKDFKLIMKMKGHVLYKWNILSFNEKLILAISSLHIPILLRKAYKVFYKLQK